MRTFLPHNLPTKKQVQGDSFAHHYTQDFRTPAFQGTWICCSQQPILLFRGTTASGSPCLLWLPGLRQLLHNIKEQKLNQVICQVIKTELEQSLSNT